MKNQMQQLLEAQQYSFDLHFADAALDPASAGVSLSWLKSSLSPQHQILLM
jgi:hypothetical protein